MSTIDQSTDSRSITITVNQKRTRNKYRLKYCPKSQMTSQVMITIYIEYVVSVCVCVCVRVRAHLYDSTEPAGIANIFQTHRAAVYPLPVMWVG